MRRTVLVALLLGAAGAARALVGCNASVDDVLVADGDEPRSSSPCSNGPLYTWDHPFPTGAAPDGYVVDERNPPTCTTHCGTQPNAERYVAYSYESLPSGSCTSDGELCAMRARPTCPCPEDTPSGANGYDTFYCLCHDGQWTCTHVLGKSSAAPCRQRPPACGLDVDAAPDAPDASDAS